MKTKLKLLIPAIEKSVRPIPLVRLSGDLHTKLKPFRLLFVITTLMLSGCETMIEVDPPVTLLSAEAVFENEATVKAILDNLYGSATYLAGSSDSPMMLGAMSADELDTYSPNPDLQQIAKGQLVPSNAYSTNLWRTAYSSIYKANLLIEGLKDNPNISNSFSRQITGEALFFRALVHLTLMGFYGEVPLATSTDYRINTKLFRSPQTEILAQIKADLESAITLLPSDYSVAGPERIRVNSYAAKALLARTLLYSGDFTRAEQLCSEIISATTLFTLMPLNEVFLKTSKEAILQIRTGQTTLSSLEGNQFILTGRPTLVALTNAFADGFDQGDQRRANWVGKFTLASESWYYPFKYKVKTASVITEHSTLLRLGECYLIRAEARIGLNKLELATADLDVIRQRAGLRKLPTSLSKSQLMDALLQERRSELFTEGAHRWLDLKRLNRASQILPAVKAGWSERALLFPVPFSEINVNANLSQNPGY